MWIVVIGIILIWLLKDMLVGKPNSELDLSRKDKLFYSCHYYGGFDEISVKRNNVVDVMFNDNDIDFNFYKNHKIEEQITIKYEDIIKVKFMNETTISQEISLGRMICFGWLGLAMKKEKKNIQEYVVVQVKHKGESISIILESLLFQNTQLLKEINKRIDS